MSRLWPHPPYAEEQPLSHLILTTHVFTRALTMGSIIGPIISAPIFLLRHYRFFNLAPLLPSQTFSRMILRSSGVGAAITMGIMTFALPGRMWGRETIEWKDRSWRLLENKGQLEVDDWTYAGSTLGLVGYALRKQSLGWRGAVGAAGLGSVAGMLGYMGWRHGVKGGKFEERERKVTAI